MTCHTNRHRSSFPPTPWVGVKETHHEPLAEDYDGQGKSQEQEASDSLAMLAVAFLLSLFIGGFLVAIIALGPIVVEWMGRQP